MSLKKQKGNMYEFVTHMWSPIKGHCSHHCSYCYMKQDRQPPLYLDEKDIRTNLGSGRFIFVCHTCDMFAKDVPDRWIKDVLNRLRLYHNNKYLLQTKNPSRMIDYTGFYSGLDIILGTTIETNRNLKNYSKAPDVNDRAAALYNLSRLGYPTMVTLEPIFDFDIEPMIDLIAIARPVWVNIGADSKGHNLPEPPAEKIRDLIEALKKQTNVKLKGNLKRIYPQEHPK